MTKVNLKEYFDTHAKILIKEINEPTTIYYHNCIKTYKFGDGTVIEHTKQVCDWVGDREVNHYYKLIDNPNNINFESKLVTNL